QFIDIKSISNILLSLHYQVDFQKESWELVPPSWRFDIHIEEDVISDILRIYGYHNISSRPLKKESYCKKNNFIENNLSDLSRSILINRGYYEIITYGFIDPKIHYTFFPKICPLVISNPISQEMSCMRFSLCPGLLKTVSYNKNRQINSMRFFEIGLCFKPDKYELLGVKQDIFLGAVVSGDFLSESWYSIKRKIDFYDLKGDLESILDQICGLHHIQ
ncbi:MAG: phenylalanine--tRNA ligase subunit beta, partial [Buchnera aphidicola]|nr:phenylalanine--tRNA ligase subunit beta [Buchnera aphidicola]